MWKLCRWWTLKLQLPNLENWHNFKAQGSHQSIPINSYGIFKSIKKLYVVILTKEKNKNKNMHHEVERQKYSYWSTSFQSPLSVHKLSPHRTIQLHCSASCQKPKFWLTAAHLVPHWCSSVHPRYCNTGLNKLSSESSHGRLKCRWQCNGNALRSMAIK